MIRTRNSDVAARNAFFTRTTADITGVTTYISITANNIAMFKDGDTFLLCDLIGKIYPLVVSADVASGDTRINIDSYDFGTDQVLAGALISFDAIDMFQEYQRKTKGTVGGLAVPSTQIGPVHSDGNIDGVDTTYIKILPRDFMPNDHKFNKGIAFDDTATTGVKVYDADTELWAFVQIPYGKEATDCEVYGNNTKVVDVFELSINASGIGTALATGAVGTPFAITTPIESNSTNYLGIRVTTTGTSQRIYGGKIVLTNI